MNIKLNKRDLIFVGAIALVHILFFLMALSFKRIYMGDTFEYVYEAINIKDHFFFYSGNPAMPIEPEYMTQRQPAYPLFLLVIYLFSSGSWGVIVVQSLLSIVNIYYCRYILTQLGYNRKYDWLLLLLIIAYPAQFINAVTIAPDILLQTMTLGYFGSAVMLFKRKDPKFALLMSIALIGGLMVKPVLYPFVVIHIAIIVAFFYKRFTGKVVAAAILPLCAMLLYSGWNYTRTGKFHFSSNQSFNAIYYFHGFVSGREGADSAGRFLQHERAAIASLPVYKDRYNRANERGLTLLRQNFLPYMAYHLKNSARILIEPGKGEMDLFTGKLTYGNLYSGKETGFYSTLKNKGWGGMGQYIRDNSSMAFVLLVLLFNIIRLAGLLIFFLSGNVDWRVRLFTFMLLGYFAVISGPIANTRYFLPVSLIAICCSVIGFINVLEKRKLAAR